MTLRSQTGEIGGGRNIGYHAADRQVASSKDEVLMRGGLYQGEQAVVK